MYRATALHFLNENLSPLRPEDVEKGLKGLQISFQLNPTTSQQETYLNGVNVEDEIRTMRISERVSEVATVKAIRTALVAQQQQLGQKKGVVMDGRDIGTTVFPGAELKIFMTADKDVRTQRRLDEMEANGIAASFDQVQENLLQRDLEDMSRVESPLKKAADAIVLDNTHLTRDEQLEFVIQLVNQITIKSFA
jgi:cytidylate kinase